MIISNSNPSLSNARLRASAMFVVFLTLYIRVCSSGQNPSPKRNALWAILAIRVCTDPHFKNRPEIVDRFLAYWKLNGNFGNLPGILETYRVFWKLTENFGNLPGILETYRVFWKLTGYF